MVFFELFSTLTQLVDDDELALVKLCLSKGQPPSSSNRFSSGSEPRLSMAFSSIHDIYNWLSIVLKEKGVNHLIAGQTTGKF